MTERNEINTSIKLEGRAAADFATVRKHVAEKLPGFEPPNSLVVQQALRIAASVIPGAPDQAEPATGPGKTGSGS